MSEPGEPAATPPDPMAGLRIREAVRAILLTPDRDVLLVPIETGVGARVGVNLGYLKLTRKATWNPL